MSCKIEYIGKKRNGVPQYWCSTHKYIASDKIGNRLNECLCPNKHLYDNTINIDNNISKIRLVYSNILQNLIPKVYVNNKEFKGVFRWENSILNYKDLGGIMLSKLNNINLENVRCNHCKKYHSDNGKFAHTPHKTHLCLYCGHFFKVKQENISNEFEMIFNIPNIKLENEKIYINNQCCIDYDLFSGTLLINNKKIDKIIYKNNEKTIVEFLNEKLSDEF